MDFKKGEFCRVNMTGMHPDGKHAYPLFLDVFVLGKPSPGKWQDAIGVIRVRPLLPGPIKEMVVSVDSLRPIKDN